MEFKSPVFGGGLVGGWWVVGKVFSAIVRIILHCLSVSHNRLEEAYKVMKFQ